MYLKNAIKDQLIRTISLLKHQVDQSEEALQLLDGLNFNKATYIVNLYSLWSREGEKNTVTEHNGSLESAVFAAEAQFKVVNKRSDVQANYSVAVQLGKIKFLVPEEYWKSYTEKH